MAKTEIFPPGTEYCCTTLWVKNSLKIALSLTMSKIFSMFYFPLKSKMSTKKWQKLKIFPLSAGYSCTTLQVINSFEIALSLTIFEIFTLFHFPQNPRWMPKLAKIEIFTLYIGHSCTTLWIKNSLEIALSLTVFDIFTLFNFPQKSKMAAKSGEN